MMFPLQEEYLYKRVNSIFKRRTDKFRGGISKSVANPFPVQRMQLKIPEEEWYGNWGRVGKKQRFLRTSIRNAFMVPASGSYPHLTIDVDFLRRDYRKGIVELTVSRLHYSKSPKARRYIFEEEAGSGKFLCEDPEDVSSIVREGNAWLRKAGFPIELGVCSEAREEEPAEAMAKMTLAEEEEAVEQTGAAAMEPLPKKKKKGKKKKAAVVEMLEEEQLEEQLKFYDFPSQLGVRFLWELSAPQLRKMHDYEIAVVEYYTRDIWRRLIESRDKKLKNIERELSHWNVLVRLGRSRNDVAQVEVMTEKVLKDGLSLANQYRVVDLLPPGLREKVFQSKEDRQLLVVGMAIALRMCTSVTLCMKVNAVYARLVAFLRFFSQLSSEANNRYFQIYSLYLLNRVKLARRKKALEKIETPEKLIACQIENPRQADEHMMEMEKDYDESLAQIMEVLDQIGFVLKRYFMLSVSARGRLDEIARQYSPPSALDAEVLSREQVFEKARLLDAEIESYKAPMESEFERGLVGKSK
ncbi:MAG: hypothetical protein MI784_10045 [Cytophagales bacterium]|nr:hypothetical protein [Cytophagales bacterium]